MGLRSLLLLSLACLASSDKLHLVFEWSQLDYQYASPEARQQAIASKTFIPENNIPMGVEVYEDRLFVTVPRWKYGVPSTLNYVNLKDNSTKSPKLIPYPSWAAHSIGSDGKPPEIISPFRVRADKCGRLWVLDSGKMGSLETNATKFSPSIIVYDLKTDNLLRKYTFPADQVKQDSGFANIAVEDFDCEKTFAYAGDVGKAGIVVYSWEKNESWRISHHYFNQDPLACEFNIKGFNFTWDDAIFGMGLSAPNSDNYSTLYFHPMASFNEFAVSTEFLRNKTLAEANFNSFKLLGSRGPNAQSSASFVDPKTGVLFYSLVNLNAVACWRTSNKEYTMKNQGRISMNDTTMIYPTDIKVDSNQNLWVLSNRLPFWMYGQMNPADVNFRVFTAPVLEAISHTACDVTARSDILDKFLGNVKNATAKIASKIKPNSGTSFAPMSFVALVMLSLFVSSTEY
ncbi:protein yellow [Cydia amplana]|uniref:protein yellow n=1 Tax=Cydia amplana TaxID=1869771 RepID=UPI002FE6BED6